MFDPMIITDRSSSSNLTGQPPRDFAPSRLVNQPVAAPLPEPKPLLPDATTMMLLEKLIPVTRPLVPMPVVMVLTDCTEKDVIKRIEDGSLAWAWDISRASSRRREVRIWRVSVLDFLRTRGTPDRAMTEHAALLESEVLQNLIPHRRPELRSPELQRLFSASQTHIQGLIDAECLRAVGWGKQGQEMEERPVGGPHSYVRIARRSVIEFLQAQRIL